MAHSASPVRTRELVRLGASLARRGFTVGMSIAIAALTVVGGIAVVIHVSDDATPPLAEVCAVSASALAWGAGMLVAFAASAQALRKDRASGVRALLRARGASSAAYVGGRVGGLALLLAYIVGGGTLVVSVAGLIAASRVGLAGHVVQGTIASLAYSIAFAGSIAPLAMAALGGRSRAGGYVWLLFLLVLPEMLSPWTRELLPASWGDVASVPEALASLRNALMPPGIDGARFLRAACALALVSAVCIALVRRDMVRVDGEELP